MSDALDDIMAKCTERGQLNETWFKAALQDLFYQETLDVVQRLTSELANVQTPEINEDDTGVNYYYTVKDVDGALERVTNHVKAKWGKK